MRKSNKLIIILSMIISTTTFWGCKKEIIESTNSAPIKYQNRYQGEIFSDTRTYENAILAIEYELNMEVADTNMMSGATEYENMFIDSFYYDNYTFENNEVTGTDQELIYEAIREIVLDSLNNYYDNTDAGNAIAIDLRVDDFNENRIIVKYARSSLTIGCGCSFSTNLPWFDGDWDKQYRNCNSLDDKLDSYYAFCMGVKDNVGYYYDIVIDEFPEIYFNSGHLGISLDASVTPTEQVTIKNELLDMTNDYLSNLNSNQLMKLIIMPNLGGSYAYAPRIIRAKYQAGSMPF